MKREAFNHPKMLDLAARLRVSRTHACGIVANLWNWSADTAPQGNIGKWTDGVIARACEWDGDEAEFIEALVSSGWVDRCAAHRLVIHDLEDHSPEWLKTKLKRAKKWFITATCPSQCTGANAPAIDQRRPIGNQRSDAGALHSALLCSAPLSSSLPDSAPAEPSPPAPEPAPKPARAQPKSGKSGFQIGFLREEDLSDAVRLRQWFDHEARRSDSRVENSEAFRLNVGAAAAKSLTVHGIGDRVALFKWLVFGRHWDHLRIVDDDFAAEMRREAERTTSVRDASAIAAFLPKFKIVGEGAR